MMAWSSSLLADDSDGIVVDLDPVDDGADVGPADVHSAGVQLFVYQANTPPGRL
jgi:hypothetical protein